MSRRPPVISVPVTLLAISLIALAGCSRERSDWRSTQAADSPEAYQEFIDEHPDSSHVATARERLAQLAEDKDWRAAAETDSLEAYQQFLVLHPGGRWAKEARVRIEGFSLPAGSPGTAMPGDPAVVPDATPVDAAPPDAGGTTAGAFGVQLGAFSSAERANQEWTRLQADAGGLLDGLSPRVVVGETSGRTLFRLQAEVRDEAQARAICGGLKVANKPCVPVLPH
jgi:hypothetical protein